MISSRMAEYSSTDTAELATLSTTPYALYCTRRSIGPVSSTQVFGVQRSTASIHLIILQSDDGVAAAVKQESRLTLVPVP